MIYRANHNPIIHPFFKFLTWFKVSRNFKTIHISGDYHEKKLPLLLIANHVSWWDGFWVSYLNLKVFKRKYHFMMLEEQLKAFPILNQTGGYSIRQGSRSMLESLKYTAELLRNPRNVVLLFPQGIIHSIYLNNFHFEKGIEKLLELIDNRIQIVFVANLIDYFSEQKPGLFIFFKEYSQNNNHPASLQNEYNQFFSSCISEHIKRKDQ